MKIQVKPAPHERSITHQPPVKMKHTTIYLMDGKTLLDTWPRSFERIPTIGEVVAIACPDSGFLCGYKEQARITMIELDPGNRTRIYLEAEPLSSAFHNTVVLLNEDYIPKSMRRTVEIRLRERLDMPIFEWTRSHKPRPVIEIHTSPAATPDQIRVLCEDIRQLMDGAGTASSL